MLRRFRFSFRSQRDIDADVREEIAFHLEMRVRELVEHGWTEEAARVEAGRQFGDLAVTTAYCTHLDADKEKGMRIRRRLDELQQDVKCAARTLRRQPAASAIALLTIALGVGAATLVFSVVYASLLAPLPYAAADRLMVVRLSLPDFDELRTEVDAFEDAGVYASNLYTIDEEQIRGGVVSSGFFRTLGVAPQMGRAIDDANDRSPLVVLGNGLWKRRFGGDPQILGRTIHLSGTAYTVIGVMPPRFQFPSRTFELWTNMPFAMSVVPEQSKNRSLRIFQAVGRLRPGLTQDQAQAQFTAWAARLATAYPQINAGITLTLVSVRDRLLGDVETALLVALGSVACLLFIACANVAGLTLARMTTRVHELAVRSALGAGRWRIAQQLVIESLFTAVCGGALGVLLAYWGLAALPGLIGDRVPRADEVGLHLPVLAVSLAAIVVGGLLVAAVPVLHMSMTRIEPALRGGARNAGDMRFGIRLRSALVVAQIALAVIVLAGALVLTRSFVRLLNVDVGIAPDRLLAFHLLLINEATPAARTTTAARVVAAITAVPGVAAAGGSTGLPPVTAQRSTTYEVEGRSDVAAGDRNGYFIAASLAYFKTIGTRVVSGREFAETDTATSQAVAIVSESLARQFFPDGDAIGRRIRLLNPEFSNDWRTIVGVAGNIRYQGLDDGEPPALYTPFAQTPFRWMYVQVRTHGDPLAALGSIRSAVKSVDSRLTIATPQLATTLIADSTADPRFRTTLISLFATAALLLAAIGLHGVIAFGVARRGREIAIRLALGASVGSVRGQVMRHALLLAIIGIAAGLAGAIALSGILTGLLYETAPTDPVALATVSALLLAAALIASALPARRATRIQPVEALRE